MFGYDIQDIPGVGKCKRAQAKVFGDMRGNIFTAYDTPLHRELIGSQTLNYANKFTISKRDVLRGMHCDTKTHKFITLLQGEIQVAVAEFPNGPDRVGSYTELMTAKSGVVFYVAPHHLLGFLTLSEESVINYLNVFPGDYSDADVQKTVAWNDPRLGIAWKNATPILSDRDASAR
jgi:dTDP-4-dehydrorhamnose 3,5-epimerase